MQKFKITSEDTDRRLDIFLAEKMKAGYSRNAIQQAIEGGFVLVNDKASKASYKLRPDDEVSFTTPPPKTPDVTAEDIPVNIIYEDDDVIVVNKPAGMVVHPAHGNYTHTLVNALLFYCKGKLSSTGSPLRPGVVHRLDKEVSGVLVLAKTDTAYRELVKQFKEKTTKRKYIAFVKGEPALLKDKISLAIGRSKKDRKKMAVTSEGPTSKSAVTNYEVLKKFKGITKLAIVLETGRTHQIRVHMSYMGYPILGDTTYGGPKALPDGRQAERIMLHAKSLGFKHPVSGKEMLFEAELPEEFGKLEHGLQ